ncbi:serine protease, partial [Quaeritorhiza haematococci]
VEFVERDQTMNIVNVEHDAPWGLVRISHREVPSTSSDTDYLYPKEAGSGVTAYVIDTGVNIDHVDFEGRAVWGATIPEGDADIDGNGHGTHVAGSVAGKKYGVAKKAKIKAVKVLRSNGSGTLADVVKGIEWAVIDHKKRLQEAADLKKKSKVKSVANMSLGGGRSRALDRAVDAAVAAGIHFAVAAGNSGDDACDYSPAASQRAVTVGATTASDSMAWFSNHGECVDIFAPGHQITSAWIGSKVATNTISGTSMASPHVAGALALLLSEPQYENMTPKELKDVLIELSSKDIITNIPTWAGGVNRLLYTDPPANLTSSKFY